MSRVSSRDGLAGPGVRGASSAPSRRDFSMRTTRYVDDLGRVYVLPNKEDGEYKRAIDLSRADETNYERVLRRGLDFNPARDLHDLTARVMMYVQLPPPVGQVAGRVERQQIQMPQPLSTARSRSEATLVLRELSTGRIYEGTVKEVRGSRRAKRGIVFLEDVKRLE